MDKANIDKKREKDSSNRGTRLYGSGNFGLYSRHLVKMLDGPKNEGCRNAMIIDSLVYQFDEQQKSGALRGGFMHLPFSEFKKEFGLNRTQQQAIFKYFENLGLINIDVDKNAGHKRYIKVNVEAIGKICSTPLSEIETIPLKDRKPKGGKKRKSDTSTENDGEEDEC